MSTATPRDRARADAGSVDTEARAQTLYEQGLSFYEQQAFPQAAASLAQSFALQATSATLFAWAQAERMAGHCPEATALFERFMAMDPPSRQVQAARLAMRKCVDATNAVPLIQTPSANPQPLPQPAWYEDSWGGALCAAGVATTVVGLALLVSAHGRAGTAEAAPTLGEAQRIRAQAETRWSWGMGVSVLGLGAFSGGIARYVWVSRTPQATSVAVGGRF